VFRLLEPFIDKGHTIFMDNYYNSVCLSNQLLLRKTYITGTLRNNCKENPKCVGYWQKNWRLENTYGVAKETYMLANGKMER